MKYPITCLTEKSKTHTETAPEWFTRSRAIREATHVVKEFDTLGLKDFTVSGGLDLAHRAMTKIDSINDTVTDGDWDPNCLDPKEASALTTTAHVLEQLHKLSSSKNVLTRSITDYKGTVLFRKGMHLKTILAKLVLWTKDITDSGNRFIKDGIIDVQDYLTRKETRKVVFSTDPWDILTMSMRGIDSCMEWGSSHCSALVGSVLCPYVGVIYVPGSYKYSQYGVEMEMRSVVRLVKDKNKPSKFHLFVEGAYPKGIEDDDYDDDSPNTAATEMFREVLAKRIKNNRKIVIVVESGHGHRYFVPVTKYISSVRDEEKTYFDGGVRYR